MKLAELALCPFLIFGIDGDNGDNAIQGGDGNDTIGGRDGNDTLRGGHGRDTFSFDTPLNAATNVDQISDLSVADDTISLSSAVFGGLAPGVLSGAAFFVGSAAHEQPRQTAICSRWTKPSLICPEIAPRTIGARRAGCTRGDFQSPQRVIMQRI